MPRAARRAGVSDGPPPSVSPIPFEPASCCCCRVDDAELVAVGRDFECSTVDGPLRMNRCRGCGLYFLNPRPAVSALDRIYPETYMSHEFLARANVITRWAKAFVYGRRARALRRLLPVTRAIRVFEVGCGEGAFSLALSRSAGSSDWELAGCELKADVAARARQLGFDIAPGRFEDATLPTDHYDLVLMLHVIEHMANPRAAVARARTILKPGGTLVIETPNTDSLDARLFRRRYWFDYQFPRHWYLFDRRTLTRMLGEEGFAVVRVVRQVGPMCWTNSIRNWILDHPRLRGILPLFSRWNPVALGLFTLLDFVVKQFRDTSRLQVVARRVTQPA
jgi:2-polyprenyl-3-methyl-5-hydroxy-6-metoxy-1,4-benzoquinol methylase